MEPSMGRVVIYREPLHGLATGAEREHPAFITRVVGPEIVNLLVMWGDERRPSPVLSVRLIGTFEDPGDVMTGWSWPEIKPGLRGSGDSTLRKEVDAINDAIAELEAKVGELLSTSKAALAQHVTDLMTVTDEQALKIGRLEEQLLALTTPAEPAPGAPQESTEPMDMQVGPSPEQPAKESPNDQGPASDPAPTP